MLDKFASLPYNTKVVAIIQFFRKTLCEQKYKPVRKFSTTKTISTICPEEWPS